MSIVKKIDETLEEFLSPTYDPLPLNHRLDLAARRMTGVIRARFNPKQRGWTEHTMFNWYYILGWHEVH